MHNYTNTTYILSFHQHNAVSIEMIKIKEGKHKLQIFQLHKPLNLYLKNITNDFCQIH